MLFEVFFWRYDTNNKKNVHVAVAVSLLLYCLLYVLHGLMRACMMMDAIDYSAYSGDRKFTTRVAYSLFFSRRNTALSHIVVCARTLACCTRYIPFAITAHLMPTSGYYYYIYYTSYYYDSAAVSVRGCI